MTREEAIDIIRDTYHTDIELQALDVLVPELAESEDERIRKELKEAFEAYDIESTWNGIPIRSIFAWLEKQKELPMPNSTELIEMWDAEKTMLKEKDFRDDAWRLAYNAFMDGFAKGTCVKFEKQKEQKPVERIEDSVKFEEGFKTGRESGLRDGQKYILNNLDSYGLCKAAEWSTEDEKFTYFVNQFLGYYENADPTARSCKKWFNNRLKSIKPQSKAEWSEGEKKMLAVISYKISQHQGNDERSLFTPDEAEFIGEMEEKLKSLRPSWKPSKDQIDGLFHACNRMCGDRYHKDLVELYEQLKQL